MSNKLKLTFGYAGTDFTRNFTISDVASSLASGIKPKILELNASVSGGTSGGLNTFFRSDDFDAEENIGTFNGIKAASLTSETVTVINLDTEGDATNG